MIWMQYFLLICFAFCSSSKSESSSSIPNSVTVQVKQTIGDTNEYNLQFINGVYQRVCTVIFRLDLPSTATVDKYSKMVPIPDTCGQYALDNTLDLLPGETFDAKLSLVGSGKPNVTILSTKNIPTNKKCRN
uniref:Cellulose binding protein n=1 Tax=Heterodera avenae TaxID=34510 RepID=F1A6F8_HETAV|nr:cellulose binding protein [Heterodera avenae]